MDIMKIQGILGLALVAGTLQAALATPAEAVVYCRYIGYPAGCVVRPGVRLHPPPPNLVVVRPRPPAAVVVTPGRPMNRGGPVNHVGRY